MNMYRDQCWGACLMTDDEKQTALFLLGLLFLLGITMVLVGIIRLLRGKR